MMKAVALAAILLICIVSAALADATNWTLLVNATADNQFITDRWDIVGTWNTYTDGANTGAFTYGTLPPGAEGSVPPSAFGRWIAMRQTTNPPGTVDMRSAFSQTVPQSKTWTMNISYYTVMEEAAPTQISLTIQPDIDRNGFIIPGTNGNLPGTTGGGLVFEYSFQLNGGPITTYSASQIAELGALSYVIATPHTSSTPDVLTLTVRTVPEAVGSVPEPGSLLALGLGIIGLGSFRRLRKGIITS